jgi:hypothetical protein
MAKLLFGPIVADARSHIAGTVFSKNTYGAYAKKKTSSSSAKTATSTSATSSFSYNAKSWANILTQAKRNDWIELATTFTVPDKFGNPQHLSGIALFIRANQNLHTIGATAPTSPLGPRPYYLLDAPADQNVSDLGGITITEVTGPSPQLKMQTTNTPPAGDFIVVVAKGNQTEGALKYSTKSLRVLAYFPASVSQPINITTIFTAKFGYVEVNRAQIIGAYPVRDTNGAKGTTYSAIYYTT